MSNNIDKDIKNRIMQLGQQYYKYYKMEGSKLPKFTFVDINGNRYTNSIDRSHHIGQDKQAMACRMVCKDTMEEKTLAFQQKKRKQAGDLPDTKERVLKSMRKKDTLT